MRDDNMNIVVVGASKGGVGKTTVSAALAVEAGRDGRRVCIADFDPLLCLSRWRDVRQTATPSLLAVESGADEAIAEARRAGCDLLIIDTAPGSVTALRDVVDVADLLIIPTRASPLDMQTLDVAVELGNFAGCQMLVVLNATLPNSEMTKGARAYLAARKIPVWLGEVQFSEAHAVAMMDGKTVLETGDVGVAKEVTGLWTAIAQILQEKTKP